jgi:phospholipase/carboxylesterase
MSKILQMLLLILAMFTTSYAQDPLPKVQEGLALKYLVKGPTEKTNGAPVIVLLHGYGSDEGDLFRLADAFPKNYYVVAARAPFKIGPHGFQWYEVGKGNGSQLKQSRAAIRKFIRQLATRYGIDSTKVYLSGFSQGAVMCYEVGLTMPEAVAGIAVLSGMIQPALKPAVKKTDALQRLRIFIAHGAIDDRIKIEQGKAAYGYLKDLGLNPEFHEYEGMGHQISNYVLRDLLKWLPGDVR